ncbi:kinase-like domain-containing protein [Trichophaea hybrida]|nr:kinase-like domain-containing protein [Trichophaea hybrida]
MFTSSFSREKNTSIQHFREETIMGESDLFGVHRRTSWKETGEEGGAEVDLELGAVGSSAALQNITAIPLADSISSDTKPPANSSSIHGCSSAGPSGAVPESDQTPADYESIIEVWTKGSNYWASNSDSFFNDPRSVSRYLTQNPKTPQNTSHPIDFIAFITLLSRIYSRGRYIDMQSLDPNNDGSEIGTGAVYRVTLIQVTLDRPSELAQDEVVTVKQNTILKSTQRPIDWRNADDSGIKSFMKELQIMGHDPLYRHPNVVTLRGVGWYYHVHDFSTPQIRTWAEPRLLLEQAETTLEDFLSSNPDLPFQARLRILRDVSCGLLQIHECAVIHGDVKPDNVLLFRNTDSNEDNSHQFNFTAKIADFSHSIIDTGSITSLPGGTYRYFAPETLEDRINPEHAKATDVFSLGMLFWRVLFPDVELPIRKPHETRSEDFYFSKAQSQVYRSFQNSTDRQWKHDLLEFLFQHTLRTDPRNRSLEDVTERLRVSCVDRDGMSMPVPITVEKSPLVDEYITDKAKSSDLTFGSLFDANSLNHIDMHQLSKLSCR